jgi:glucosamine--fructose-6-phosphate aminotransferase (isomerizing)
VYAKYLISAFNRTPVGLAAPSLFTLYDQPPVLRDCLVIGISQSGQTPDVCIVLEKAREQGALCVAITNAADSPLAEVAHYTLSLDAGEEQAVPASKTYTAQLAAIAMLSSHWEDTGKTRVDLEKLPTYVEDVLHQHHVIREIATRFAGKDHLLAVARGFNHCTTQEIALKIKELSYMVTQAYSAADFRHGPIAMLEEGFPILAIAPRGKSYEDMHAMIAEIRQTGADLVTISNVEEALRESITPIGLPDGLPEWLSPIVATIPGQLLALELALAKGFDPDSPRRLHKVTRTI